MTKLLKSDIDKLLLDGQEYEPQELKDKIEQLVREKERPDDIRDIEIFHDKEYKVKRVTFGTIKKYVKNEFEFHYRQLAALTEQIINGKQKLLVIFPFLFRRIENRYNKMLANDWMQLVNLTFEGDLKEMELDNLTQQEVIRLKRIFFRWRPAQNQEKPDK